VRGAQRVLLLTGFLIILCTPAAAFDHAALAERTLERHILPGYQRFADAAHDLADKAAALCRTPSTSALARARAAAGQALLVWGRIEHIRFGPITEKQRLDRLVFYPDPRRIGRKQIGRLLRQHDDRVLSPETLAHASVAVQGFTAVDRVLFGNDSDALAAPSEPASFRCRYLRALADGVAQIAAETLHAWQEGFAETWLHPGGANRTFLTAPETTQALLRAYVTELEVVRLQRLAPLLGADGRSGGQAAEPLLARSGLGVAFLLANIEGVRNLLTAGGFIDAALATDEKERDAMSILKSVVTDLGFALRAGKGAQEVASDAFANSKVRARLIPLTFSLKNAEVTGRTGLSTLTGSTLGFNSLDGD
jgi:hypothetical protein